MISLTFCYLAKEFSLGLTFEINEYDTDWELFHLLNQFHFKTIKSQIEQILISSWFQTSINNILNSEAYATIEGNFETICINDENSRSLKTQLIKSLKIKVIPF